MSSGSALTYAAGYFILAFRASRITKLDYAVLLFLGLGLFFSLTYHEAGLYFLQTRHNFCLFICLFLAAGPPVFLGAEPFTLAFARRTTAKEFWETPQFIQIYRIMTLVWAALFLSAALITLIPGGIWTAYVIPPVLMLTIGPQFNKRFPDW